MRIAILHTRDAIEPPEDAVLGQLEGTLRSLGHDPSRVMIDSAIEPVVHELGTARPELVFNLAESYAGKSALESNVAAMLNLLDLRYTGSSPAGLLVAGDKALTKKVLTFHGVRTPQFATVYRGAVDWAGDIDFPVIVKPPQEDASLGIHAASVVRDIRELLERMSDLQAEYQQPVLVEQFIDGREFYIGVLGNANARALPVIELVFSHFPSDLPRIASWEGKWGDGGSGDGAEFAGTKAVVAEGVEPELVSEMQRIAVEAFHALRLRDYARIDLRVTSANDIYVIEVNPNCYLERDAEFARAAAAAGMAYEVLVARIIDLAAGRYAR